MATMPTRQPSRPDDAEHDKIAVHLERATKHLEAAREHGRRAQRLREEQERLERLHYGRRFILIRF